MIIKVALIGCAVFIGWLAVLAGVMIVSDDAPAAFVVLPAGLLGCAPLTS